MSPGSQKESVLKTIKVTFDPTYGTAHQLTGLLNTSSWECETDRTMLLIGLLTTPPRYTGLSLTHYWAWLKYSTAIHRPTAKLKLRRILGELDPHQKTVLADDFGIGFPCHYLIDQHSFEDFADTNFLLQHVFSGVVTEASKPLNGPAKMPDFIAVDSSGALHILECKGTQTSRAYLSDALVKGIAQKNNLSNGSIFSSCMVGGIYVPRFKGRKSAEIMFVDPEPAGIAEKLGALGKEEVAKAVRRVSLAKTLAATGLIHSASTIMRGKVSDIDKEYLRRDGSSELEFSGYKRLNNQFWERTLQFDSYEPDDSPRNQLVPTTTKVTTRIPADLMVKFRESLGQKGTLPAGEVDGWIAEIVESQRRKSMATATVPTTTKDQKVKTNGRTNSSTWSALADLPEKNVSGWSTGMGFEFSISTTKTD